MVKVTGLGRDNLLAGSGEGIQECVLSAPVAAGALNPGSEPLPRDDQPGTALPLQDLTPPFPVFKGK